MCQRVYGERDGMVAKILKGKLISSKNSSKVRKKRITYEIKVLAIRISVRIYICIPSIFHEKIADNVKHQEKEWPRLAPSVEA